jgi:hypothetical protein
MVDEELARQRMEITGEEVLVCDCCGRPMTRAELTHFEPAVGLAGPSEEFWYCPTCRLAIERGEAPLELADDVDVEL